MKILFFLKLSGWAHTTKLWSYTHLVGQTPISASTDRMGVKWWFVQYTPALIWTAHNSNWWGLKYRYYSILRRKKIGYSMWNVLRQVVQIFDKTVINVNKCNFFPLFQTLLHRSIMFLTFNFDHPGNLLSNLNPMNSIIYYGWELVLIFY